MQYDIIQTTDSILQKSSDLRVVFLMNGILFYNSFAFRIYSFKRAIHNDNSGRRPRRFFGRLLKGSGRLVSADKEILLSAGDVFYIPHDIPYHSYWTPDSESGIVEWESYQFEFIPSEKNRCFHFQKITANNDALRELDLITKGEAVSISDIGHFYTFLGAVLPSMSEANIDPRKALFERAEDYIFRNPDFRVPELAKHLGISESGLYSFFKDYADTTPIKVKNRIQAGRALSLLSFTDLTVEEISDRLGFQSVAYFRKIIKEQTGKTPSEIRKAGAFGYDL